MQYHYDIHFFIQNSISFKSQPLITHSKIHSYLEYISEFNSSLIINFKNLNEVILAIENKFCEISNLYFL